MSTSAQALLREEQVTGQSNSLDLQNLSIVDTIIASTKALVALKSSADTYWNTPWVSLNQYGLNMFAAHCTTVKQYADEHQITRDAARNRLEHRVWKGEYSKVLAFAPRNGVRSGVPMAMYLRRTARIKNRSKRAA